MLVSWTGFGCCRRGVAQLKQFRMRIKLQAFRQAVGDNRSDATMRYLAHGAVLLADPEMHSTNRPG